MSLSTSALSPTTIKDPPPSVILINGFPGVGKCAVSRALDSMILSSRVIDKHLLIDPVWAIEPERCPEHDTLRKAIRKAAFDGIKNLPGLATTILTGCISSSPVDKELLSEHVDLARSRRCPFLLVNLSCDEEENVVRLQSLGRIAFQNTKLLDPVLLREIRQDTRLFNPYFDSVDISGVPFYHLGLDTTSDTVGEVATKIMKYVQALDHYPIASPQVTPPGYNPMDESWVCLPETHC
ncbi:MAG: hypothetical protein MMC33_006049 [Icmadophila ericetorum]|nr:hypothetical protein [Icmadophila ericetorum]